MTNFALNKVTFKTYFAPNMGTFKTYFAQRLHLRPILP